jgi:hypothetical protein
MFYWWREEEEWGWKNVNGIWQHNTHYYYLKYYRHKRYKRHYF